MPETSCQLLRLDTPSRPTTGRPDVRQSLLGYLPEELIELLAELGQPRYRALQLFRWMHHRAVFDFSEMSDLPAALREALAARWSISGSEPVRMVHSADGLTAKLLLRLRDGQDVEVVDMQTHPRRGGSPRRTVCVSTQAGCAMGCVFCVTGQFGFARNLEAGEIAEQVIRFSRDAQPVSNVVFMGMGEPLANYEETVRALRLLTHPDGLNLGARRITLSTSGLVPEIRRLAREGLPVGLAISLHAPNDRLRSSIMPVNRRWPIAQLLDAARDYFAQMGRRVSFEYTLMDGVNDADALADELAVLLADTHAHVNLIPLNPTADPTLQAPSRQRALAFQARLQAAGIAATIRLNRGRDINAACGQLRLSERRHRTGSPTPMAASA